jgi:hypothetical protein
MTSEEEKMKHEQEDTGERSGWGSLLAGCIFILTCLFILGFFWQSIMSVLFLE